MFLCSFFALFTVIWIAQRIHDYRNDNSSDFIDDWGCGPDFSAGQSTRNRRSRRDLRNKLKTLRRSDPNFSKYLFLDFCTLLFTRFTETRGGGQFETVRPYVAKSLYKRLRNAAVEAMEQVVVGSVTITKIRFAAQNKVQIQVDFEASYRQKDAAGWRHMYAHERWTLVRNRDCLSPEPGGIIRLGCPSCGAATDLDLEGRCNSCDTVVNRGNHGWIVKAMSVKAVKLLDPIETRLNVVAVEAGTTEPTVFSSSLQTERRKFLARNPEFDWGRFTKRTRSTFIELQHAWSSLDWERARPLETDTLFQGHRFWIERYKRQQLRNVLDEIDVTNIVVCNIEPDPFYEAITVRIFSSMLDYTVDLGNELVGGNEHTPRQFSEYWTFIRSRKHTKPGEPEKVISDKPVCPSCGVLLEINQAGVCTHCDTLVASGEFDWVLALIQQDESYQG
jgi:predicted lipid-binding transport protein (Tim44 family)